ncbi:MAG: cryptochrome/photolyase family protein [Candidatus Nanopelagicales bacterium]
MPSILWLRRDLRLHDHPALLAAAEAGEVLPVFVLDPRQLHGPEAVSRTYLLRSLRALNEQLDGGLCVRVGEPETVIPALAREVAGEAVHISADYGNFGRRRDAAVAEVLAAQGLSLVASGSPYAVAPGRVLKADGTPYRVYTPFHRAWLRHGWRAPAVSSAASAPWLRLRSDAIPADDDLGTLQLPPAGEVAAHARWQHFRDGALADYATMRDRADLDGSSQLSAALRFGELHPRSLLAELGEEPGHEVFRKELAWREFYADVLWHNPHSAHDYLDTRLAAMEYDRGAEADLRFRAWCEGRTGYPFVDAGMRQLRTEGWMHNRLRMVVASFLVKDLHLEWQQGAQWFARWLRDFDLASNQHGWQWAAGSGTDASPYFRIFNPVAQGQRFDPHGDYVRRYVPELQHISGAAVHEPWATTAGYTHGYPQRLVDHGVERAESLRRYQAISR